LMYVDIDHYRLGIESGTMAGHLFNMQDRGEIPPMTGIIRSGRGMWALWLLVDQRDGTDRPPTAHTHRQLLWRSIERELIDRFADFDVDKKVKDVTRIARVLLDYASPDEGMARGIGGVERITQSDLAARVGTVRDMGSRALSHLEDLGAIELRRGRVIRLDRAKLEVVVKTTK